MFLDLAFAGGAEVLVSGDGDLLACRGEVHFAIETPAEVKKGFELTSDPFAR
jgi:predicted nucleic acid-binding protein